MTTAPVVIVANTLTQANELISELGLTNARPISTHQQPDTIDGMRIHAILVAESALPLDACFEQTLRYNLMKTASHGGIYELHQHRP